MIGTTTMPTMRLPSPLRHSLLTLAGAITLAVGTLPGDVMAQRLPNRTVPQPIDFATSQNDNLFSLVRSQEDIHSLELAQAELAAGQVEAGVRRLEELLRQDPGGVVPVAPGRFVGLRYAVMATLANLSASADEFLEQLLQREGHQLLAPALTELSTRQLAWLADRFPSTGRGLAARLRLGDLAFESGDGVGATAHYRQALDATPIGSTEERLVSERLALAGLLIDPALARTTAARERLFAAGKDVLATLPAEAGGWNAVGGGRSGRTPMDRPCGNLTPYWRDEVRAPGFERDKGELAMQPVGDLDAVFVNTGHEVLAFDPLRASLRWASLCPMREAEADRWRDPDVREYGETINQDAVLACAVSGDVVVAALQVPDNTQTVDFQASFRIMSKIPQRRLFAFSRRTGKLLWRHFDELEGALARRFRGHDACGPPLIAGDTVYVPMHDRSGAIAFSVGAYDLATGRPKWRRLVCSSQQEVNMFGNARMEFAASPLCFDGGVLYGSANLGVAYAVDAATGRVRWITAYDVVRMPPAMLHGQPDRPVYFGNNAPAVTDGVVCLTPLDSQFALGIDVDSGRTLWRLPFDAPVGDIENRVLWLAGALDDEFVLAGAGVVAVRARPERADGRAELRQCIRPEQLGDPRFVRLPARPVLTADRILAPTRGGLQAFDFDGRAAAGAQAPIDGYLPGNLLATDGIVVSLRQRRFEVFADLPALLRHEEQLAAGHPDDPARMLRLATVRRAVLPAGSDSDEAVLALYRRGLARCEQLGMPLDHPVRNALQRELYREAHTAAESARSRGSRAAAAATATARDLAPDVEQWLEMQGELLELVRDDEAAFRRELVRLGGRAPTARMPGFGELPVAAYALWQEAMLAGTAPARAVACWQELLERFADVQLLGQPARAVAEAGIAERIARHGDAVYAPIEAAAAEALTAAGDGPAALQEVALRYPNSRAGERARLRLLDLAVEQGDLAVACKVFAGAMATAESSGAAPGVLRRLQIAAVRRGNLPLARAVHTLLRPFADQPSDWPADAGATYGSIPLPAGPAAALADAGVAAVPDRTLAPLSQRAGDYMRVVTRRVVAGFAAIDSPLYTLAGRELLAFDLPAATADATGRETAPLFRLPVEFLEEVLLCGPTLIVPDMQRVFAVDARTGELRWELGLGDPQSIECLGVQRGVLHLSVQPSTPNASAVVFGVEPLTGAVLFQSTLRREQLEPKAAADELLVLTARASAPTIERLDPLTGRAHTIIDCRRLTEGGVLQFDVDSLALPLFPQGMAADEARVYLPVDGRGRGAEPIVVALQNDGAIAWQWTGRAGALCSMMQRRGDRIVVVETSEQRPGRALVLDAASGATVREIELGHDALVLNWDRSRRDNPAPAWLTVESQTAPGRGTVPRQLVCVAVDDGPSFAFPLAADDGSIVRAPQFGQTAPGRSFVTFATRSSRPAGPCRIYSLDLDRRDGAFADGRRYHPVELRSGPHAMHALGPYTILSTTQGLLLLGPAPDGR